MGAQPTDEAMPPSPFTDGTGFCSVCLYRTPLWVAAEGDRPAAWLCEDEDSDEPRLRAAPRPSRTPTALAPAGAALDAAFGRDPGRAYWERPADDPAPTVEQLRLAQERAAQEVLELRRARAEAEPAELREQLARWLGAKRAVDAARSGGRWVPLGFLVRGRHERH